VGPVNLLQSAKEVWKPPGSQGQLHFFSADATYSGPGAKEEGDCNKAELDDEGVQEGAAGLQDGGDEVVVGVHLHAQLDLVVVHFELEGVVSFDRMTTMVSMVIPFITFQDMKSRKETNMELVNGFSDDRSHPENQVGGY